MKKLFQTFKKKNLLLLGVPIGIAALGLVCIAGVYAASFLMGPPPLTDDVNTVYYSMNDNVIGEEKGRENRRWADLDDISPELIEATLAIEDRHFYDHNGFDIKRIVGAALTNLRHLSLDEGASTLTQQYARNLYLSHQKTWWRKIKEAFYTIRLEMYYSKDELLEGYLNTIYYGHGNYGAEAASEHLFNEPASDLTLAESAMLAGIPKGPAYYSPLNDMSNAKDRQKHILDLLRENGSITQQQYLQAKQENLALTEERKREPESFAPYFKDMALNEAARLLDLDKEKVRSRGLEIHTTLDTRLQKQLKESSQNTIQANSKIEIGAMARDPDTGGTRAVIGGRNYTKSPYNRAVQARRMAGSAFKPFLYYAALENGYTPVTMLKSEPSAFKLENGEVYKPSNYNDYYAEEEIPLAQALALSDNIYAVKTHLSMGADKLKETAKKTFDLSGDYKATPSLALGTAAVTLDDMVSGYSMLANGGDDVRGHTINKIVNREGQTIYERDHKQETVLDPKTAFVLTHLMTGMFDSSLDGYMSVTGSTIADKLSRTYAGKSGTTETDSWMMGYSPELVTGVWMGYDDNRPITKTAENTYAKKIWASFMEKAHNSQDLSGNFNVPEDVIGVRIDPETGKRATSYCDKSRLMYFTEGTEPDKHCSVHMPEEADEKDKDDSEKDDQNLLEQWWNQLF